jgi:hypothetical protein
MNDGKSTTCKYYVSLILEEYRLDYVMKLDADSILYLHDYQPFADMHLPPAQGRRHPVGCCGVATLIHQILI